MSQDALSLLKETSRTFYIPISRLPPDLRSAVASGYLCMRAIDAVEDGPAKDFCTLPLALAQATLDTITKGFPKLSRQQVMAIVAHTGIDL